MVKLAKSFPQLSLKFANLTMGIVGIAMLTYGLWIIRAWQHGAETSPSTPNYVHFPWFIHAFLGVGTVLCAIACLGHYMFVLFVLLLLEIGMSTHAFLNSDWDKDLAEDPSGRFDDFKEFVKLNSDVCQWISRLSFIAQGLSIFLATLVSDVGKIKEHSHENEGEYAEPRVLLLRHPQIHPFILLLLIKQVLVSTGLFDFCKVKVRSIVKKRNVEKVFGF